MQKVKVKGHSVQVTVKTDGWTDGGDCITSHDNNNNNNNIRLISQDKPLDHNT